MELCTFMTSPKVFKTAFLSVFGFLGCVRASGDMVGRFVPNSDLGGCSGDPVMVIFVSHVGPYFPNIGCFEVYEGIWRLFKVYGGYLKYMTVYKGPPMVSGNSPLITAPLHRFPTVKR